LAKTDDYSEYKNTDFAGAYMQRKKICIFMNEIVQNFQQDFGKFFSFLANREGIDVFIYTSYGSYSCPYGRNLLSEIGKKNIIYLPDFSVFDAIIALPNSFDINGMDTELYDLIRKEASCPVFCLQSGPADFKNITIDNKNTVKELTEHFIKVHGLKKIYYMSGPLSYKDSPDRLAGYKEAMAEAGLEILPNYIYEGNYWTNRGKKAMDHFLAGSEEFPEAIICANDYMALSICDELRNRGKAVPEDVAVTGFDGTLEGAEYMPSLTTVVIEPEKYALKLLELIKHAWNKEAVPDVTAISEKILYRASCGCGAQVTSFDHTRALKRLGSTEVLLREAGRITADYQNDYDLDNALSVADFYFHTLECDKGYVCLCKEEDSDISVFERNSVFTERMILKQAMHIDRNKKADILDIEFDRRDILPLQILNTEYASTYIIYPLHFKSREYGYLVLMPSLKQWANSLTCTYINTLSGAIENSYYEKQFRSLSEAKKLSQTDPLTGLNNRRGFEEGLSKILSDSMGEKKVFIASIDMDGLKQINDTYGHADGDLAIVSLAEALKASVKEGEMCVRFGGDEFLAVLVAKSSRRKNDFLKAFRNRLEKISGKLGKPYRLGASIGICELEDGNTSQVIACMQNADRLMYEDKRSRKNAPGKEG